MQKEHFTKRHWRRKIQKQFEEQFTEFLNQDTFTLKPTTYDTAKKEINNLKNDCSTGFDTILVKFLKPASEYFASQISSITV